MSCKALGIALKLTFEGRNQFVYPQTFFFILVVASAVVTQVGRAELAENRGLHMSGLQRAPTSLPSLRCMNPRVALPLSPYWPSLC